MATYKSIAYDQALSTGGSQVLLSETTASSDSTISFTSGIDSTYKEYIFKFALPIKKNCFTKVVSEGLNNHSCETSDASARLETPYPIAINPVSCCKSKLEL